jgi:hypothetical protein
MASLMIVHRIGRSSPENEALINRDFIQQAIRLRTPKEEHTKITFHGGADLHVHETLESLLTGRSRP